MHFFLEKRKDWIQLRFIPILNGFVLVLTFFHFNFAKEQQKEEEKKNMKGSRRKGGKGIAAAVVGEATSSFYLGSLEQPSSEKSPAVSSERERRVSQPSISQEKEARDFRGG